MGMVAPTVQIHADTVQLDPEEYPTMTWLLQGPNGTALRQELTRLAGQMWRLRAERRKIRVFAKLEMPGEGDEKRQEVVRVEDISTTGVKVAISRNVPLDLMLLADARIVLRVGVSDAHRLLEIPGRFVRLASHDARYAYLAFRFTDLGAEHEDLLARVSDLFFV